LARSFIHDDFLLTYPVSQALYHDYAADCPIIDYHNHLDPAFIASNHAFSDITEVWLSGDHYKWRAMRANGIPEDFITGNRTSWEKFSKWAYTVPFTMRNPLYHWTHLELKRYFGLETLLDEHSAREIYMHTNELLTDQGHHTQGLLEMMNVSVLCTTDDPADSLEAHIKFKEQDPSFRMLPGFRPDRYVLIGREDFIRAIEDLEDATGENISSYSDLVSCLEQRVNFFAMNGCSISDHGLSYIPNQEPHPAKADGVLKSRISNKPVSPDEIEVFMVTVLHDLCLMYSARNWVMQFHLGALRNNNFRLGQILGTDAGCDSIGDFPQAAGLSSFLDRLDSVDKLPKTILYNLNPADNEVFATMAGNFNDGTSEGKVQWGSAWWFLDQKDGMEAQINVLSNMGLLYHFIGMLTDSRSFLSFPRHEYFRRILCNLIGRDVKQGLLPNDLPWLGKMVRNICYFNAARYFSFHGTHASDSNQDYNE
jgi:glucuronate isomerase